MSEAKCCGTCRYFTTNGFIRCDNGANVYTAICLAPVPPCYRFEPYIKATDGTTCPCWQAKQDDSK